MKSADIKNSIKARYGKIARQGGSCCTPSCCTDAGAPVGMSRSIGYTDAEITRAPEGSNLGLGCGNPLAFAELKSGETVVDLGSGAGFDSFLAAGVVGPEGRVIGVDMTPDMVDRARVNAERGGYGNVEFRLGDIEDLPLADSSVDVVISNCVINLSPDKPRVFREAHRVLRVGGRLLVSDLVLTVEIPDSLRESVAAFTGCIAGASSVDDYLAAIRSAGFGDVEVLETATYPIDASNIAASFGLKISEDLLKALEGAVRSVKVRGVKKAE